VTLPRASVATSTSSWQRSRLSKNPSSRPDRPKRRRSSLRSVGSNHHRPLRSRRPSNHHPSNNRCINRHPSNSRYINRSTDKLWASRLQFTPRPPPSSFSASLGFDVRHHRDRRRNHGRTDAARNRCAARPILRSHAGQPRIMGWITVGLGALYLFLAFIGFFQGASYY